METAQAKPKPKKRVEVRPELPPVVPSTLEELDEAVRLLGAYIKANGSMKPIHLETIKLLVGALPRLQDAPGWKSGLKRLRGELLAQK